MISEELIEKMMGIGVLMVREVRGEELVFDVNFKLCQENFPDWMDFFIQQNLHPDALSLYHQGYLAYIVQEDGSLAWKPTLKAKPVL